MSTIKDKSTIICKTKNKKTKLFIYSHPDEKRKYI